MGWEITQKWANPYSTSGMGWEILQKWAFQGSIERDFWLMGWEIWQKWAFQTLSSEISDFMGWEIPLKWAFQSLSSEISDLWFEKSHRNEQFRRDFWLICVEKSYRNEHQFVLLNTCRTRLRTSRKATIEKVRQKAFETYVTWILRMNLSMFWGSSKSE